MQNMGSSGLLLLVALVLVLYKILRPARTKKEERANLKRVADALIGKKYKERNIRNEKIY